jgi:hypothetical protein
VLELVNWFLMRWNSLLVTRLVLDGWGRVLGTGLAAEYWVSNQSTVA